jgi:hypothetical protein
LHNAIHLPLLDGDAQHSLSKVDGALRVLAYIDAWLGIRRPVCRDIPLACIKYPALEVVTENWKLPGLRPDASS